MAEPVDPKAKVIGTIIDPPAASPTESRVDENTGVGQLLDNDGTDIRSLFAAAEGPGELGRLSHFRILKKLGAGGMGMVLLAEDTNLLRQVALKIMLPKFARSQQARERFLREARTAARIHHDHVVTIHHVGQDRDIPYIAMEFLQGAALDKYLDAKKTIPLAVAMRIGREVAEGLKAAHAKGLIHRDIKPANIWLEAPKGRVKILDFGLAYDEGEVTKLTHSGAVLGTPSYMSPEQAAGEPVDQRTDLFSLGVVLYELVTGRLPFTGKNTMAVLKALSFDPHPSIADANPQLPAGLINLIDRLLAKKPEDRPASAAEVVQTLTELARPASRSDGKPIPDAIDVPMATAVMSDPFAEIDATAEPVSRDAQSSERSAESPVPRQRPVISNEQDDGRATSRKRVESSTRADSTRLRDAARQSNRPRWLIPAGIVAFAAVVLLAVAFLPSKKPAPSEQEVKKEEPNVVANNKTDPPKKDEPKIEVQPPITKGDQTIYDLGNGVKLEMIKINAKGKKFMMGSPKEESDRSTTETQHEVTFGYDFSMGKYEVTQEQYEAILGENPSSFKGARKPVDCVSWDDAQKFIKKLNEKVKSKERFRLPSDAEWEFACRAGTTTAFNTGATITKDEANFDGLVTIPVGPRPVGTYRSNKFGLYDMHGNVSEWCEDYYGAYEDAPTDGASQKVKRMGENRVVRGGSVRVIARYCRSANRAGNSPDLRDAGIGFRVVVSQDEPIEPKKANPPPPPITKGDETSYDLGNGVKLEMIKINANGQTFMMGSPKDEPDHNPFEKKFDGEEQHEVTFSHDFSMGKYEVTQEQYEAIMGENPAQFKGAKRPVERVSWNDAQEFNKRLNEKLKGKVKFRLPSEAEWEYACRAGTTTAFNIGNTLTKDDARFGGGLDFTKPVGTYKPNKFGLYDMHGNVHEWCEDYCGDYKNAPKDGSTQNVKSVDGRVLRGGSYIINVGNCRSAFRSNYPPDTRTDFVGFRVVASQN